MSRLITVDGKQYSVPDDATDAEINQIVGPAAPAPAPLSMMQRGLQNLRNGITGPDGLVEFGKGAAKGAIKSLAGIDSLASQIPGVRMLADPTKVADMQRRAMPNNSAQSIGQGVEQAAEFLVPGVGEDALAAKLGGGLLARVGTKALGAGAVNKVQGGSFTAGALMGGAGEGIAQGLKAAAPILAEAALGIHGPARKYGRQAGDAILNETTGYTPGVIAGQARDAVSGLSDRLNEMAAARPTTSVNLAPAREAANAGFGKAVQMNNDRTIRDMGTLSQQITSRDLIPGVKGTTRVPIPEGVSATEALALKQGVGTLQEGWDSMKTPKFYNGVIGDVYHALDSEIDRALPGSSPLNDRMSSLIPVVQRATATSLNDGVLAKIIATGQAPTGALIGGLSGAAEGRREGGLPGAIAGGVAGLVLPRLLTSPTSIMTAARMFNNPALSQTVLPGVTGAALAATRKKDAE